MYLKHFYTKKARNVLKGIDSSVDFISLREGDSMITRTNKNEIAKTYRAMAKDVTEELEKSVYAYNYYQAKPRQVVGSDVRVDPATGVAQSPTAAASPLNKNPLVVLHSKEKVASKDIFEPIDWLMDSDTIFAS